MGKSALKSKPSKTPKKAASVKNLTNPAYYENKLIYMVEMLQEYTKVRSPTLKEFHIAAANHWNSAQRRSIWRSAETHDGIKYTNPFILIVTDPKTGQERAIEIYNRG